MEIVLLLAVITLIIIFQSGQNSRIKELSDEIKKLKDSIKLSETTSIPNPSTKHSVTPDEQISTTIPLETIVEPELPLEEKKEDILANDPEIIDLHKEVMAYDTNDHKKAETKVQQAPPPKPGWWEQFKTNNPDLEKFIGENLISKIGIAILVLGIGFFVKYAIDKDWINETARVGIGILCGAIVMAFAHRLRKRFKAFSSVLVAGAVATFYFTITIAFQQYHIFGQTLAFAIITTITAFSVFVSIGYDRIELAALSLVGGFAAPFMVSTGEGNYKVLFTYILILDGGMLVLAALRKWNLINILAYIFTVLLYGSWLGVKVAGISNGPFKGAFIFATAFYFVFVAMNIVNNIRSKKSFSILDITILLSNTFFYYLAGMLILREYHPEFKGLFTIILALLNLFFAWLLFRKFSADKKIIYLFIGLTLTFVTLAAPVQLKGNYITLFWAAESVLLVWLAQRTKFVAFRGASIIVQILMLASLVMDWEKVYAIADQPVMLNKAFITGISAVLSFYAIILLMRRENNKLVLWNITFDVLIFVKFLHITAAAVLYFAGLFELNYQSAQYLASNNSVQAMTAMYHIAFTTLVLHVLFLRPTNGGRIASIVMAFVNMVLYIFAASQLPYDELKEKLQLIHGCSVAFAVHYVSTACLLYTAFLFARESEKQESPWQSAKRLLTWMISCFMIFIASNELLLHALFFGTAPMQHPGDTYWMDTFLKYDDITRKVLKIGFPILWGLLSFVLLTRGIKKPSKDLRILSLALLAATLVKLFAYDIKSVPEAGKIIAFIILGVLLLVMSFMYQKIKAIILDDEVKPYAEKENDQAV